jgi:hypothetical protein
MNEKIKMMKKLGNLANKFVGGELYNSIIESGFGDPGVLVQNTGFEGRCVASLEIDLGQLHITFLVSHNNLDEVSVNIFNEDLFETDEDNCSFTIEFPFKKLNLTFLEKIVFEEIMKLFPENEEN